VWAAAKQSTLLNTLRANVLRVLRVLHVLRVLRDGVRSFWLGFIRVYAPVVPHDACQNALH